MGLLHFSHELSKLYSPSFSSTTLLNFASVSDLLSEVTNFQHHTKNISFLISFVLRKEINWDQPTHEFTPGCVLQIDAPFSVHIKAIWFEIMKLHLMEIVCSRSSKRRFVLLVINTRLPRR
jgi:hypothetical protein